MDEMLPISVWWFILDVATRRVLLRNPAKTLPRDVAARIHAAGGVLFEPEFFTGTGTPQWELLPDDIHWIEGLPWHPLDP